MQKILESYYNGKKIIVVGGAGFKGLWLSWFLKKLGADVTVIDIDYKKPTGDFVQRNFRTSEPHLWFSPLRDGTKPRVDLIFHLGATAEVIDCYQNPLYSILNNIYTVARWLEECRQTGTKMVVATTDKVYRPSQTPCKEGSPIGGYGDPYSASKACVELIVEVYKKSYDMEDVSTVRCGNVIGPMDFSQYRLVPMILDAIRKKEALVIRNLYAVRPYLDIVDACMGYLLVGMIEVGDAFNLSPSKHHSTEDIIKLFREFDLFHVEAEETVYKEQEVLLLDSSKATEVLGWEQKVSMLDSAEYIIGWNRSRSDYESCLNRGFERGMKRHES